MQAFTIIHVHQRVCTGCGSSVLDRVTVYFGIDTNSQVSTHILQFQTWFEAQKLEKKKNIPHLILEYTYSKNI